MRKPSINLHKTIKCAVVTVVLFAMISLPVTAFARPTWFWERDRDAIIPPAPLVVLTDSVLDRRHEGLDIRGIIPVVTNYIADVSEINEHIEEIIVSLIAEARRLRARSVSFSYNYHPSDEIISVVIYANVATTLPHTLVRSVNFCVKSNIILSMNEATGMEIVPLAERILAERIRANPERYYAALSAPLAEQAFYLSDNELVILFDGFRLSTRVGDVDSIEINLENITTVVLPPEEFRTAGPYGLKMIQLRKVVSEKLHYDLQWDEYGHFMTISRNGVALIELRPNDNDYIVLGAQRRSLEAAPQIIDGRTHVPITFFDQILPLTTYAIGADGSITFLAYFAD